MPTFLQLCQKTARQSDTLSGTTPSTVVAQTDRLQKVVEWTNDAYRQIQNAHGSWRWMQAEFYGPTVIATQRYAYTAFNDLATTAAISRFGEWIRDESGADSGLSIYSVVADEGPLVFADWEMFYAKYLRGTPPTSAKPSVFSIAPDNKLVFAPIPNAVYTVRGRYRKDVQELTVDADTPECPARFHDAIVDLALIMLMTHDESPTQIPLTQMRKSYNFCNLERDQLPRLSLNCGPLA